MCAPSLTVALERVTRVVSQWTDQSGIHHRAGNVLVTEHTEVKAWLEKAKWDVKKECKVERPTWRWQEVAIRPTEERRPEQCDKTNDHNVTQRHVAQEWKNCFEELRNANDVRG